MAAEVKDFDPLLYMDKGEVRKNDPFSQFAIAAATQAVNDSEIMGKIDPERFGVYFGSGIGGIQTFSNQVTALNEKGPRRVSAYFIPMLIANIAGGNIAIKFNAQGSCLPITTACATSNNEIGEAYRAIKHGYLDAIIAGGAEAAIVPVGVAGFGNMTALTTCPDPEDACCPFDKRRSGFVMGEGGAALILEEYEHAKARGARMYAEIVGYGATDDAHHMTARIRRATAAQEPSAWHTKKRARTLQTRKFTSTRTAPARRSTSAVRRWPLKRRSASTHMTLSSVLQSP